MGGELRAVITTDALELGIDIGALDAAVVVTFPGTVASLRQMWGRAGRRGRGLAVYVAGEDALDQFFCRHPDEFLERPVEAAILDHESEQIHRRTCSAPRTRARSSDADAEFLGPRWQATPSSLVAAGELRRAARPASTLRARRRRTTRRRGVSLRSASPDSVRDRRRRPPASCSARPRPRARHRPSTRARSTCTWAAPTRCASSTWTRRRALVAPFDGDWYTQPKRETDTDDRAAARPPRGARRDARPSARSSVTEHGARLPAQAAGRPRGGSTCTRSTCRQTSFRRRRSGSSSTAASQDLLRRTSRGCELFRWSAARRAARHRARADRGAAADRDVRPLGHRRAVDQRPPADRRADDLHLRRPSRRRRHHAGRLRAFEELCGDARRLIAECPCAARLPVVRAVAQVRQPQRAAVEGRRARSCCGGWERKRRALRGRRGGAKYAGRVVDCRRSNRPQLRGVICGVRLR